jgi:hypothetical protein
LSGPCRCSRRLGAPQRSKGKLTMKGEADQSSPHWKKVPELALRANCGNRMIYRAIRADQLRAVRIGGRGEYRATDEWLDEWLIQSAPARERPVMSGGSRDYRILALEQYGDELAAES